MLRKLILGIVVLFFVSCAGNKELVSYTVESKTQKVTTGEALKDMRLLYSQVSPQEMNYILSMPDIFKLVVQSRLFESKLIVLEAKKLSNYQEDPAYIQNLEYQTNTISYEIAFQKGQEMLSNEISRQSVEIAEVSRIMFTNQSLLTDADIRQVLEELLADENPVTAFSLAAEKYSQEMLGAQNGGYLGQIQKGQFPVLDEVVFVQKQEGIYPEILEDQNGSYLIFVHSPVRNVKVADFEKEGITLPINNVQANYLNQYIKYLFTFDAANPQVIVLDGVEKNIDDLTDKDNLISFWNKKYSVGDLHTVVQLLMGGALRPTLTKGELISLLSPSFGQQNSQVVQQLAMIFKGYKNSIKNSKLYKERLAQNQESMELETVYAIMSQELFKEMSTNVSTAELEEFYNDTNNRQVVSYSDDGTPVYAGFTESQETMTQMIVSRRAEVIQQQFRTRLDEEYSVTWNEENFQEFMATVQAEFDKYLADNGLDEGLGL